MPPLLCPRCQRLNPAPAVYCWFDGNLLRMDAAAPVKGWPKEFAFPSGRRCRTMEDFVQGCQYEWEEARDLLRKGAFARFFTDIKLADVVRSAQEAQTGADPDAALYSFLRSLPASQVQGPKLDFSSRRLVLKNVKPGEIHVLPLKILNQGKGILQGKVTVSEGENWLRVDSDDGLRCPVKAPREQDVILHVDTRGLAAPQCYSGKLTIISNGGIAEVPVRLDLGVTPFPVAGPFKGATQPRELAERMKANPKAAVPLLENGEIQKWFAVNGWTYPIFGTPARGVAAVQQFFEGMGLSKPPPLMISENEVRLVCVPPEVVQRQITLYTQVKKWVYGQIDSDSLWLKVLTPNVAGPQAVAIAFEVDSSLLEEGQVHVGHLTVTANGGQRSPIKVVVDVQAPQQPFTSRLLGRFFQIALIAVLYRLLFFLPGDVYARVAGTAVTEPAPGTMARWATPAAQEEGYLRLLVLATWWIGAVVGFALMTRRKSRWSDLFTGAVAGAVLGVAAAVTVGCLVTAVDFLPRRLAGTMGGNAAAMGTILWLVLVSVWWAVVGAGLALLPALGKRGRELLQLFCQPLLWMLQRVGLRRLATRLGTNAWGGAPAAGAPATTRGTTAPVATLVQAIGPAGGVTPKR